MNCLTIQCEHYDVSASGRKNDRTCYWYIAAPDPPEEIVEALKLRNLIHIPGMVEFYVCFNRSGMPGTWFDCRSLPRIADFHDAKYASEPLPWWNAAAYKDLIAASKKWKTTRLPPTPWDEATMQELIRATETLQTPSSKPEGMIDLREWYVLHHANNDWLIMNKQGKIAWLIACQNAYVFDLGFDGFLKEFAQLLPREGTEFMWDYFEADTIS